MYLTVTKSTPDEMTKIILFVHVLNNINNLQAFSFQQDHSIRLSVFQFKFKLLLKT